MIFGPVSHSFCSYVCIADVTKLRMMNPFPIKKKKGGVCCKGCHELVHIGGFPGGTVVENLPANAGDTGLSPGLGRSHMPRSNYAREPQLLSLRVWSLCSATREAAIVRGPRTVMKSGPHLPQLEKALAQKRRPNTAIKALAQKRRSNTAINK